MKTKSKGADTHENDERKKQGHTVWENVRYVLGLLWTHDRLLLMAILVSALTGVFLPFFGIYLPEIVIDLLLNKAGHMTIVVNIGGFMVIAAALYFLNGYFGRVQYWHAHKVRNDMMWKLFVKSLHCDYENIENAAGQTKYFNSLNSMMGGDWSGLNRLVPAVLELLIGFLGFTLYTGIIATLNAFVILALILVSLVTYFALANARNFEHAQKDNMADLDKKINYIQRKDADAASGKDTRIFRMKSWFLGLQETLLRSYTKINTEVKQKPDVKFGQHGHYYPQRRLCVCIPDLFRNQRENQRGRIYVVFRSDIRFFRLDHTNHQSSQRSWPGQSANQRYAGVF